MSSVAGFHGLPGRTGYSASKFAMHGFLETIRIENLKKGLHVMIIAPGFTSTEIRKHALTADGHEQGESPRHEQDLMSPEYVAKWVLKGIRRRGISFLPGTAGLRLFSRELFLTLLIGHIIIKCRKSRNHR